MHKTVAAQSTKTLLTTAAYIFIFAILAPLLHFTFGIALDQLLLNPFTRFEDILNIMGAAALGIGFIAMLIAVLQLKIQGKGYPISSLPPQQLVTSGSYRISRHPIYLAAAIVFLGASLLMHSFWTTILGLPLFILFFTTYALAIEEAVLLTRFGAAYQQYRNQVPLFLPIPGSKSMQSVATRFLFVLNDKINRPFILKIKSSDHILFLGYGIWCGLGVALGLILMKFLLIVYAFSNRDANILIVIATATGLLGTRVAGIISAMVFHRMSLKNAFRNVKFVSWGVLVGFILVSIPFSHYTGKSSYILWDASSVSLMVAHVFGRIGCSCYGCCFGKKQIQP